MNQPEPTEPESTVPPELLIRSFLNIASGAVVCFLLFFGIAVGLAAAFFPDVFANMTSGDPEVQARIAAAPQDFLPRNMFLLLLAFHTLANVGLGWMTARVAPFAPFGHVFFLAVFVFVGFLQTSITGQPGMRGVVVSFMFLIPLAILLGGRLYVGAPVATDEPTADDENV